MSYTRRPGVQQRSLKGAAQVSFIKNRKSINRSMGGNITIMVFLLILAFVMALPLIYIIINSLKPIEEIFLFPPRFFVIHPTLNNFVELFKYMVSQWVPFLRYLFNSFFISVFGTAGHLLLGSTAAYALAKHKFPGRKLMNALILLSILFTSQVTSLPQYIIIANLGWVDTYLALIIPAFVNVIGVYLMSAYMALVPDSVLESARIDGTAELGICWRIVMPNVKPAYITLLILSFNTLWQDPYRLFIYDESLKGLSTALSQIASSGLARAGIGAAAAVIMVIPPAVVIMIFMKQVIETYTQSGIKE